MGKGDRKSRKGKIWSGSNGKSRPTTKNAIKDAKRAAAKAGDTVVKPVETVVETA